MARIIYAVAGEGFGHSSRSHLIGQRLLDAGHDVVFVGSAKSLVYLKQYFGPRVEEIFGLSFDYEQGHIDTLKTVKKNILQLPTGDKINRKLFRGYFKKFKPELIISDFEPFSAWWALRNKVPFLSIDHEHVLSHCRLKHPSGNFKSRLNAYMVTRCYYFKAARYIVINFFSAPLKRKSAVLAPPIVRPVVSTLQPSKGNHIVMYSTTGKDQQQLHNLFNKFPSCQFYIYGFDKYAEYGNCIFKQRSTEGFLNDLASAKGVIASAGFSLISECMYLKKKMLLLPLAGQYEQIINAHYVQKLVLGLSCNELDESVISNFLDQLDKPMPTDERILWPNNEKFFDILRDQLNKLPKPITL